MSTTIFNHPISSKRTITYSNTILSSFMKWCEGQEQFRLLWIGIGLGLHGCVITPLMIILITSLSGEVPMIPFAMAMLSMVMVLIANLAALPTKITIPVFFLSILADIAIAAAVLV